MKKLYMLIATCFGIGNLPLMPGTWASLAALPFFYVFSHHSTSFFIFTAMLFIVGTKAADKAEALLNKKDPGCVVIDEFVGQLICFYGIGFTPLTAMAGFCLFRLFDILKPGFIRKSESLPGGLGVMVDDLLSGIVVNVILRIVIMIIQ